MSNITAECGRPIKIPGPFSASRISAYMEGEIGRLMAEAVAKEGHVARMPPDPQPEFKSENYFPRATETLKLYGRAHISIIRAALKISTIQARVVLNTMKAKGLVRYVAGDGSGWELTE